MLREQARCPRQAMDFFGKMRPCRALSLPIVSAGSSPESRAESGRRLSRCGGAAVSMSGAKRSVTD
jgi:hypothetical protein